MSSIRRNIIRTVLNSTEKTAYTDTVVSDALAFNLLTTDSFYIGHQKPFASRYFLMGVVNTVPSVVSVKYWNGTTWAAVDDLIDQTAGFTKTGFMAWLNEEDWKSQFLASVPDVELYWIKVTVGTNLSATTTLQAVLNLFADDILLRTYYPEIATDTRYLPPGRTDFMEQYVAAKDYVVTRLKQNRVITDESQIIDVNEVAVVATHFAAWMILRPIAESDADQKRVDKIFNDANFELGKVKIDIDQDNDGIIDVQEENSGDVFIARGSY